MHRAAKYLPALLGAAALTLGLWLGLRFVLPPLAPFLAAFALAAALERGVRALCRRGVSRRVASAIVTLLALGSLLALSALLTGRLVEGLLSLARLAPELFAAVSKRLSGLEDSLLGYAASAPEGTREYLQSALDAIYSAAGSLGGALSERLLSFVGRAAQASPGVLLFTVTAAIGTYFVSASFPSVTAFIRAQLPDGLRRRAGEVTAELSAALGGWLRAQLILASLTFFELLLGFLLLGVNGAFLTALVTALIDALPVFGTGAVLVPWALYLLAVGESGRALWLLALWAAVSVMRNCVQARLIGSQIGLDPLVSLLALYVGWRVWGVGGMIVFPLGAATLQQLGDRGVIHLWREP